jgi:hypothetical protein
MNEEEQIRSTGMCLLRVAPPLHSVQRIRNERSRGKVWVRVPGARLCVDFDPMRLVSDRRMEIDGCCRPDHDLAKVGT